MNRLGNVLLLKRLNLSQGNVAAVTEGMEIIILEQKLIYDHISLQSQLFRNCCSTRFFNVAQRIPPKECIYHSIRKRWYKLIPMLAHSAFDCQNTLVLPFLSPPSKLNSRFIWSMTFSFPKETSNGCAINLFAAVFIAPSERKVGR